MSVIGVGLGVTGFISMMLNVKKEVIRNRFSNRVVDDWIRLSNHVFSAELIR